ncbi:MAG: exosome complex protein Rrp42 [Candidatus Woesearchaeota archaeon]|nr:MAG: exosome complex protein Rrp42 [Candidatus Woesearchaeota archaeon]
MKILKSHLKSVISKGKRDDGRELVEYRDIKIEVNPIQRANGSARVRLGNTDVIVGVKIELGEPFPDTPEDGVQIVNAELNSIASPDFEEGPPRPEAIELARVVDRGIREGKAIDTGKLCITPGEKVWCVFMDIYPMNADGNLFDASALAAIIALKNARFPKYDKKTDEIKYDELTNEKLPIKTTPILNTYGKINNSIFLDPSSSEEKVLDARISVATLENGNVCAMQKGETGTFTIDEINKITKDSKKYAEKLRKLVK